ncbi:MAG: hypothetical protein VB122_01495 [Erysipelotrichales bacterium]|nr:hypothetical protein [Erysipelotrichales bacterium]
MLTIKGSNSKTLASLALMESNLLSQDYISSFLPFVATLVLKKNYEAIDIGTIVKDFKDEFGINITRAPMQSILSKAVTNGLIKASQDGRFLPIFSEMQKISFLSEQSENQFKIDAFLTRFVDYAQQEYSITLSKDESIDIFISFLDEYSPRTVSGDYSNAENEKTSSNRNLYLMGDFIQTIASIDLKLFGIIRRLAMSYLIVSALTFDEPTETRAQEFSNIVLYLDTPIILRLLGLQTTELRDAYAEMFSNFSSTLNPTYMIFQHTFDEISGIIADCVKWIENPSYNPIYANPALLSFVKKKFSKTQVELFRSTLEAKLAEMSITVDYKEYYNLVHRTAQIDVVRLKEKLIEAYQYNNPQYNADKNQMTIDYDIRSIENIVKLWGTKSARSYSNLGYMFITSNSTLAYVSRRFTSEYWWDSKNHKSPCVTDYYLGTMVWLSTPSDKMEGISKLKLLADCSAATALSREVMEKFLYELKRLQDEKGIKNSDYLLLRQYAYENNYIQKVTLNEETAFKDDTLDQILEDIKSDIQKPLVNSLREKEELIGSLITSQDEQRTQIEKLEKEKEEEKQCQILELNKIKQTAEATAKKVINTYAPIAIAFFAFIAVLLQLIPALSNWFVVIKILSATVTFVTTVFLGVMKSNFCGAYSGFVLWISRQYQVKQFKNKL